MVAPYWFSCRSVARARARVLVVRRRVAAWRSAVRSVVMGWSVSSMAASAVQTDWPPTYPWRDCSRRNRTCGVSFPTAGWGASDHGRSDERRRLKALIVQLIPTGQTLSKAGQHHPRPGDG